MGGEEKPFSEREEVPFSSLVLMFHTSGLIALGQIPDPITQETKEDLPQAKQSISALEMLERKTKGNLTPQEERELAAALYQLRMAVLQKLKGP
ncbi:MAG: DUF1844 domain-containing protein [candidate division NC10 bacterium]|nr:DUF1844 domain-containing protein [candidate division NC10 bacterium]